MKQEFSKILSVYSSHFKPVRSYTAAVGLLFSINKATTTTTAQAPGRRSLVGKQEWVVEENFRGSRQASAEKVSKMGEFQG